MGKENVFFIIIHIAIVIAGCVNKTDIRFELHKKSDTGIDFSNDLAYSNKLNPYTYRNYFNGGGVGLGDFNNDDYIDIYFAGNNVDNKLYLNNHNFTFTDITQKAGVASPNSWSTGVSVVDINGDGWLDIYVAKSGDPGGKNRYNQLFINQGDSTFVDGAEKYGLAIESLSNHAVFFDYDRDGDLDMYLLKNSFETLENLEMVKGQRKIADTRGSNAFYENREGKFVDVTRQTGIYSSKIGFGLGATVSDINRDGWPDIYISNDFFERDYLYINNKGKGFRESLNDYMQSISLSSMGSDIADLNHDGYPEIFVTDMLPESEYRLKTKIHFYTWDYYKKSVKKGYHYQFARNTLQLNNKNGTFSEIGRMLGVDATDWSWAALIADFDLNGYNDLFVANGIYKDLTDQDYVEKYSDPRAVRSILGKDTAITKLIDKMPSQPVSNYLFAGYDSLKFVNRSDEWGLSKPGFSNGSAYADLDNDGDLDLVTNNVNSPAGIYENRTRQMNLDTHWLQLDLKGRAKNKFAVGAKVYAWAGGKLYYREQFPARGFQSTISHRIHLGLGSHSRIDSLLVVWPDQSVTQRENLEVDRILELKQDSANSQKPPSAGKPEANSRPLLKEVTENINFSWSHQENKYNDFKRNPLLFHMRSTEGPAVCIEDIDKNGLDDIYLGGAKGQPGSLWQQTSSGAFHQIEAEVFHLDKGSEDVDCAFLDIDNDGDEDLYVVSGGMEFTSSSSELLDRLYINEEAGWVKQQNSGLPVNFESNSVVRPHDFNSDGLIDLFVGTRMIPWKFGLPVNGKILMNNGGGQFRDITEKVAPALKEIGLITAAEWFDYDNDGDSDLLVAGEWMSIHLFEKDKGKLHDITDKAGLGNTKGWWNTLKIADLDNDGDNDFIAGNHGVNSQFRASVSKPISMYVHDFDFNGSVEQIVTAYNGGKAYPVALKDELLQQIPALQSKITTFSEYAGMTIGEIFDKETITDAYKVQITELRSIIGWNKGDGMFTTAALPQTEQRSPLFGVSVQDIDNNGRKEIVTGGNLFEVKPYIGRYDAHYGSVLTFDQEFNIHPLTSENSGVAIHGAIRHIKTLKTKKGVIFLIVRNNDEPLFFKLNTIQDEI